MKDGNEKRIEGKEGRRCFVQHRAGRAESLTATKERTIRTIKSGIRAKAFCSSQIWLVKSRLHPGAVGCLVSSVSQAWPVEGLGLLQMAQLNKLLYLGTYFTIWRALSTQYGRYFYEMPAKASRKSSLSRTQRIYYHSATLSGRHWQQGWAMEHACRIILARY